MLTCILVGFKIWMKRDDVAKILGHKEPHKVVNDCVFDKFRSTLGASMVTSGPPKPRGPDHNFSISTYIFEAVLYNIIFKSHTESA